MWPVDGGWISSEFGPRNGRLHEGLDIAAGQGTPIGSAAAGIVTASTDAAGAYRGFIEIQHADGIVTRYGHLVEGGRAVEVGDWVEAGDVIALVGSTGRSTGPHLHFEVHVDGAAVDPLTVLP